MNPTHWRARAMPAAVWLALCLSAPPLAAAQDEATLRFELAPGIGVHAALAEDGQIDITVAPAGTRQRVPGAADEEGRSRLSAEDVDFDGRPELVSRASVGQVNEAVSVYRFDPGQARFVALEPATHGHDQCGGLMGLTADAPNRTLDSSCRSGPMWYVDFYRYDGPRLYLYRAERMLMLDGALDAVLSVEQTADSGPLAVWSTFDPAGNVVQTAVADGLDAPRSDAPLSPIRGRVVPARLPLYTHAGDSSTRRYLVQGDVVELLDEAAGWVQVRYRNATRGPVQGWVQVTPE